LECASFDGALDSGRGRINFEKSIQNGVTLTGAQASSLAGERSLCRNLQAGRLRSSRMPPHSKCFG
jgi:hypothetical protein